MAISVAWGTKVISVPKADTTLVDIGPPEKRSYDIFELLWKELIAAEDDEDGMAFIRAQDHVTTKTLGGITLAHVIEIINGYTVTFEDGQYQVALSGANHNVLDVQNPNQVSLLSSNSPGLVEAAGAAAVWDEARAEVTSIPAAGSKMSDKLDLIFDWIRNEITQDGTTTTLKTDGGGTLGTGTDSEAGGTVTKGKLS